ncbi:permease [Mesotoga sp. Brook.08.YT.4.2.5.1]|uniref:permease n=1 Tax=unclassified Mesotoga TaxID=1184398 RepID=UPI000C1A4721|nr:MULTISPECIES: permease [unclassified Mesotoga]PNE23457.1 permease [Mesotoga sp. Brook.08.YT.4.2.5.1]PVD16734.1 permease [Mesotoga sp. Brook.08.105.5.1]RAO95623.1 permease [Mesotoga sp. Brook.08.YT.4.2.5.4.]RDI92203.1 permease [Mesotoga sp. Brook.08.YT.4.2.5.2.]
MYSVIIYAVTGLLLLVSLIKSRKKTLLALKKAWISFERILPELIAIMLFVGLLIALLNPETISQLLGESSGVWGLMIASIVGSITLIPGFVAFPTAAILVDNGAGITQIALFISTLMMVGVATFPVEKKYFGSRLTIIRNVMAFGFSFIVAGLMGMILG